MSSFRQTGLASWYGPKFHGQKTASGETFNMYELTAAHKTLPFQTRALVTNLETKCSVQVRINDRGPFVPDRIIDLSYAAAKKVRMLDSGTARVEIRVKGPCPSQAGPYFVQVGSFRRRDNARSLLSTLRRQGYQPARISQVMLDGTRFWRVQTGPFPSLATARKTQKALTSAYASCFILAD